MVTAWASNREAPRSVSFGNVHTVPWLFFLAACLDISSVPFLVEHVCRREHVCQPYCLFGHMTPHEAKWDALDN